MDETSLLRWMPKYRTFESNMFLSIAPNFNDFRCFKAKIKKGIHEFEVIDLIKKLQLKQGPATVYGGEVYFIDEALFNELSGILDDNYQPVTVDNRLPSGARIIGSLIYQLLDIYFSKKGATIVTSAKEKGKKIYYVKDDPLFVVKKEIEDYAVTCIAVRGLRAKLYAGSVPGKVLLFLVPEGKYEIEAQNLEKWVGRTVWIRRKNRKTQTIPNISRYTKLSKIEGDEAIINDEITGKSLKVPLNWIKIPVTSSVLSELSIYEDFLDFTSFVDKGEFTFLKEALDKFEISQEINLEYKDLNVRLVRYFFKQEQVE
ncbi:hypothetical protein J7K27_09430 [Candidatus Bathyarchaeota archaeon]|nr:hypothetical protein [Candidatus Bathyarchaeota archaeon]